MAPNFRGGVLIVNKETDLAASSEPQILPYTLGGTPIRVRATPVSYTWRTSGNQKYATNSPNVADFKFQTAGWLQIGVSTTFSGEYQVPGVMGENEWITIEGNLQVDSTPQEHYLYQGRNQLIDPNAPHGGDEIPAPKPKPNPMPTIANYNPKPGK